MGLINNSRKWTWSIIILIILLAATVIRFYQLGNPSRGFYLDEAAIGYNAYSILKTGKDEFGKSFPLLFRSFTDFKAPLYIYLSIIPIKIFGLTPFSTRFLSALSGTIAILIAFLWIKLIVNRNRQSEKSPTSYLLPCLVALVLAIAPWHVFYSRGAWEANLSFLILLTASYLCLLGFKRKKRAIFLIGSILFVLSTYTYHGQRIVAPLIFGYYLIFYRKWLFKNKKFVILGFFILVFLTLPILKLSLTPGGQSRVKALSIFSRQTKLPWLIENSQTAKFLFLSNNRYLISIRKWVALYTAYFSPRNLFSPDPAEKQRWLVDLATFYPWQFIFFIIGLFFFIRKKEYSRLKKIILPWLFFSPVAAALTGDPFSTVRAIPLVFPFSVLIGLGIYESIQFVKQKALPRFKPKHINVLIILLVSLVAFISLISLAIQLLIILPHQRAKYWEIGYSELAKELLKYPNEKIVIDNFRGEAYIHILFFTQFDPGTFQKEAGYLELPDYYYSFKRVKTKKFGQFEYRQVDWKREEEEESLIVGDELIASKESILNNPQLKLLREIKHPDQSIVFRIIKAKGTNSH